MAAQFPTRPAPFGAETTLRLVRFFDRLVVALRGNLRAVQLDAATVTVPARALADVGVTRPERLEMRYSQVAARV